MADRKKTHRLSASVKTGLIALAFLVLGFQSGKLFYSIFREKNDSVASAAVPDSVYIHSAPAAESRKNGTGNTSGINQYGKSGRELSVNGKREAYTRRTVESFAFDPNTVSSEDLQRLGFSEKQALAILNYRNSGGRFRRKADFAKSYVVSDSIFRRLEPYIDIPLLDINAADSAAFDDLPGIGPYFAARMVEYRDDLGGYSYTEQLMDIRNFDKERYDGLSDLIFAGPSEPYPLWSLPEDSLKLHPYIGSYSAHGIVIYKENTPPEEWSVQNLDKAGILRPGLAEKLALCRLEPVLE